MRTFLNAALTAALVAGGVALTPVAAYANHATVDCRMVTFASATGNLTGDDNIFTGFAVGYVLSNTTEPVTVRCYVQVESVETGGTPTATGVTSAVAAGQVTFTAVPSDTVELCADWTAGSESGVRCFPTHREAFPYDGDATIDAVLNPATLLIAPTLCPLLVTIDDTLDVRGVIDIKDDEGDLSVQNVLVFDCPPFEPHDRIPGGTVTVIYA